MYAKVLFFTGVVIALVVSAIAIISPTGHDSLAEIAKLIEIHGYYIKAVGLMVLGIGLGVLFKI